MPRWYIEDRTPLAALRASAGLSRNVAAVALNVGMTTLARYENGDNDVPLGIAEKMAVLYKVPFDSIREAASKIRNTALQDEIKGAVDEAKNQEGGE